MQSSTFSQIMNGKSNKHFSSAYNELGIKLLRANNSNNSKDQRKGISIAELLLSPKIAKEIENKLRVNDKDYQDQLYLRLYNENNILNDKNKELALVYEEEMLKDCTFNPSINTTKNEKKRDFDKFLSDQNDFLIDVKNKKKKVLKNYNKL